MASEWVSVLGWSIFFIGFIVAIILFASIKKFYPVMYLVAISTYIFTIGWAVDVFSWDKNARLLVLGFTSILFIALGFYFTKKYEGRKSEFMSSIPDKTKSTSSKKGTSRQI